LYAPRAAPLHRTRMSAACAAAPGIIEIAVAIIAAAANEAIFMASHFLSLPTSS
jgi:hypothetical protein